MDSSFFSAVGMAPAMAAALKSNQTDTPTTGQTVTLLDTNLDGLASIMPVGTLALLTVAVPSDANSVIGQKRDLFFSKAITGLTINGATILNNAIAAVANSLVTIEKVAANTWIVR